MSGDLFVDTNVLVYARDLSEGAKDLGGVVVIDPFQRSPQEFEAG